MKRLLIMLVTSTALLGGAAACGAEEMSGGGGPCDVKVGTDTDTKPKIEIPEGCEAPKALTQRDVVNGSGAEAKNGDAVAVQYVGVAWSSKKQFDASWDRGGQPFTVQPLGDASVITGWNKGLVGVKKGTRRLLVIPPDQGYGASGTRGINPNETLVFVVDVVSVNGK